MTEKYALVDTDLSRHVRDAAYWKRPVGAVISGRTKGPVGAHLYSPTEDRGADASAVVAKVDALVKTAEGLDPDSPEYRAAWNGVSVHLNMLSEQAKAESGKARPKSVKTAKKGAESLGEHLTIGGVLVPASVTIGAKVAAAAASLLGASESSRFAEEFERLSHNFYFDAGLWVGLALLLSALAARLQSALKKRKAKKIEAARAARGKWKTE